jgi:hypothetical protein
LMLLDSKCFSILDGVTYFLYFEEVGQRVS